MKICRISDIQRKLDPNTYIKFPPSFLPNDSGSNTFIDIRIGCNICSRGLASTMDVGPSQDYFNTFIPLKELDLRMPYYNNSESLEEMDKNYEDSYRLATWYVWYNPEIEYVYKLRNMLRILHQQDIKVWYSGVGMQPKENVSYPIDNYYGSDKIPGFTEEDNWSFNYIDTDEITLCPGCYLWSSFVYPETITSFKSFTSFELAYLQWLNEYEDQLIVQQ